MERSFVDGLLRDGARNKPDQFQKMIDATARKSGDGAKDLDVKTHWEKVYKSKAPNAVRWYRPHLETSIALIERAGADLASSIIDVGAGESTLADDLLSLGYENITALDISEIAINVCKKRLGATASRVRWLVADVTAAELSLGIHDVWHDRAVFHFLTTIEQRRAYVRNVARSVRRGGYVIIGTFGPEGPSKCSGLDVVRYDAESLHHEFGSASSTALKSFTRLPSEQLSNFSIATAKSAENRSQRGATAISPRSSVWWSAI